MPLTTATVLVALTATVVGATVQGSIGFGMNLVTVPVLAIIEPKALPATVVLLGFPVSITMMAREHQAVDRPAVGWILLGRVPGTIAGTIVVALVATSTLSVLVGVIVLVSVAMSAVGRKIEVNARNCTLSGVESGVMGTAAGIGGPPLALLYQHHEGPVMRSTLAASFFFGTILSIGSLAIAGKVHAAHVGFASILAPAVFAGIVLSRALATRLDRGWLRPAVLVFASLSAVVAIVNGLR